MSLSRFRILAVTATVLTFLGSPVVAQCNRRSLIDGSVLPVDPRPPMFTNPEQAEAAAAAMSASTAPPPEFDCAVRHLALEFGQNLLPWADKATLTNVMSAALNLSSCSAALADQPMGHLSPDVLPSVSSRSPLPAFKPASADAPVFYVSPSGGSDNNPGSKDRPFATIKRAQLAVRTLKSRSDATVFLRKGTFHLNESLAFSVADASGDAARPVVYTAYDNEPVTLAGGRKLDLDWSFDSSTNVSSAKLPAGVGAQLSSLYINGQRALRARWPNGSPYVPRDGFATPGSGSCGDACRHTAETLPLNVDVYSQDTGNLVVQSSMYPLTEKFTFNVSTPTPAWGVRRATCSDGMFNKGGNLNRFDTSRVLPYWNSVVPDAMFIGKDWTDKTWSDPSTGDVIMYHPAGWGSWAFQIGSVDKPAVKFSKGGFQEARGGGGWGDFYVEGIKEELDAPNEFFADAKTDMLYVVAPAGVDLSKAVVETGEVSRLIGVQGSKAQPVVGLTFRGFTLTQTRRTFLDNYEVPSGGDWAINPNGVVFVEGAEAVTLNRLTFDQTNGNAVFLSSYTNAVEVSECEFRYLGQSAIATVGYAELFDGRAGTQPTNTVVRSNLAYQWGLWVKQTSFFFEAVSRGAVIENNVLFHGPRAGVNFNDGFGGGSVLRRNLIFGQVLSTGDHGPFNSWDRQPYLFTNSKGELDVFVDLRTITQNFICRNSFVSGNSAGYCLDHDDGSSSYYDVGNFLYQGSVKNRDGLNKTAHGNLFAFPNTYMAAFQVNGFQTDVCTSNTLLTLTGAAYGYCAGCPKGVTFVTGDNTFVTPNMTDLPFNSGGCGGDFTDFKSWQAAGHDVGSTQTASGSTAEWIAQAKALIDLK